MRVFSRLMGVLAWFGKVGWGSARHECRDPQFELRAQAKPPEGSSEEWKDAMRQEDWLMAKKVIIWIVLGS
jgi:hypothetical protein